MRRRVLSLCALLALGAALPAGAAQRPGPARAVPRLDAIEVRLLYQTGGSLSQNVARPAAFSGWNTMIGEGDAKEPARDALVLVRLSVATDEANSDVPLSIRATGNGGKLLAERTLTALFFRKGRTTEALFVPETACVGTLKVVATLGKERRETTVKLDCGE